MSIASKLAKTTARKVFRCTAQQQRSHRSIQEAEQLKLKPIFGANIWYESSYDKTHNCMFVEKLSVQDLNTGREEQFIFDVQYLEQKPFKNLCELVQATKNAFAGTN